MNATWCRFALPSRSPWVKGHRRGVDSSVARWAHNPEVAGSNPAPATKARALLEQGDGLCYVFADEAWPRAVSPTTVEASDPPMMSSARVLATWRSASSRSGRTASW